MVYIVIEPKWLFKTDKEKMYEILVASIRKKERNKYSFML